MKILIVGPAYPWRGGIAHHTGLLARHLAGTHDVRIVTFSRQYPSLLFPGKTQFEETGESSPVPTENAIDSINPLNWIRIGLQIRRRSPDLVIIAYALPFFGPCYGTIAALARFRSTTRVLFLCHNILPHEKRPGDSMFTRFAFAFSDMFIVQSEAVREDLLRLKPKARYEVVHHPLYEMFESKFGTPEARRMLGISGERIMLFFGYVRPYKGLSVLLRAMSMLEEVKLLVAGEFYESEDMYREQIDRLKVGEMVHVVNRYIPKGDIPKYFCAADVIIVPYLSATQSGIIQMAYNFDRPVIATGVGGLSEVVDEGKTGHVVPPNDPQALAAAVRKFYERGEGPTMSHTIRDFKKKFGWNNMVLAIERLMRGS